MRRPAPRLWTAAGLALLLLLVARPAAAGELNPTHKFSHTLNLGQPGQNAVLNTLCLSPDGRLLVGYGGQRTTTSISTASGKPVREVTQVSTPNEIRIFNAQGEQIGTWSVDVVPQAINFAPDGTIYVAGNGEMARLDATGQLLNKVNTPQLKDIEEIRKAAQEQAEASREEMRKSFSDQLERAEDRIQKAKERLDKMQETANESETKSKAREKSIASAKREMETMTRSYESLKKQKEDQIESYTMSAEQLVEYKMKVSGIAVTGEDVFVAVPSVKGYGYDVWRTDHNFDQQQQIVTGLRGCCGQMDIQARDDGLYVAENSKHRVCRYDRDGQMLNHWGEKERVGNEGFEGCCNPMNLRFGSDGDVLTAESGVGIIKRFSPEGEFLGIVGTANLAGGCKHVAIAASEDGEQVFMLDITRNRVAVLKRQDSKSAASVSDKKRVSDATQDF